jgi:hypothetical protein
MILLLPIGLLLLAALAILILDQFRPKFGTSWLIASLATFLAWLAIVFLRLRLPTLLDLFSWESIDLNLIGEFSLLLDYDSWPYVVSLITIALAVILTDAARTRYDSTPRAWSASLVITALGLLALQSGTSLTLMISWVIVDLLELFYFLKLEDSNRFLRRIIISYGVRTASIISLGLATTRVWHLGGPFDMTQIPPQTGFFFLLAAGLRLGVLPLNLPFLQEPSLRRGAGNIIRLAPVASSLCLLARLPADLLPPGLVQWSPLFRGLLAIAALYAAFRWLRAGDEIEGRPFWIIAWSSLATVSVLNGAPKASLAWGTALILPGSLLFLYYPRIQRMNFLMQFGLIGLVGLPFTPLASGWAGLVANGITLWTILFTLIHAVMILGYLNRTLQPGGASGALESWARLVYPLGLIIIIQATLMLGLIGWPGSLTLGTWWAPLISTLLVAVAVFLTRRLGVRAPYIKLPASSEISKILDWLLPRLEPIFRLDWLYQVLWWANTFIGKILKAFSKIFESEGGILWTVLLFVLLIALLAGRGGG